MENWKDIPSYEGLYQVSNLGRVKSLNYNHTGKEKILTLKTSKNGYLQIGLSKNGKQKFFLIHRLVAIAFIPNPDNLPQVNHKDECRYNNCVDNLEWCDSKYNCNYGTRNKKLSEINKKTIYCIELDTEFDSITEASEKIGCDRSNISKCLKGKRKTAGGYHWNWR